jgi:hypothetical protein
VKGVSKHPSRHAQAGKQQMQGLASLWEQQVEQGGWGRSTNTLTVASVPVPQHASTQRIHAQMSYHTLPQHSPFLHMQRQSH